MLGLCDHLGSNVMLRFEGPGLPLVVEPHFPTLPGQVGALGGRADGRAGGRAGGRARAGAGVQACAARCARACGRQLGGAPPAALAPASLASGTPQCGNPQESLRCLRF